jgi:glycerate dehydrogenase
MPAESHPKIVVADGFTLSPLKPGETSPDHPAWDALAELGELTVYDRTSPSEMAGRCAEAEIILTNKAPIRAELLAALPKLRHIGVMATGTNIVDLDAARERGISVSNVPGYSTMSVAQHVFALMFELAARIGPTDAAVKAGDWQRCNDFCFTVAPFTELAGKNLGLVGFGAIAQAVAGIGYALGMNILVQSRTEKSSAVPVEWVSVEELFRRSDVISLHCPLTPETTNLVNDARIALMKPKGWIINTGRGPLVDEAAVAAALHDGRLGAFAADVLTSEPPVAGNPLIGAPRTVITPHIAWASVEARQRLMVILVENVRRWIAGEPRNLVN